MFDIYFKSMLTTYSYKENGFSSGSFSIEDDDLPNKNNIPKPENTPVPELIKKINKINFTEDQMRFLKYVMERK